MDSSASKYDGFERGTLKIRPVTCCLGCRKRKVKCDRSNPCRQCLAISKPCVFVDLDQSRQRRNLPRPRANKSAHASNSTSRSRSLETTRAKSNTVASSSRVLKGPGGSGDISAEEKAETETFPDGDYDHDNDDSEVDWTLRIGKLNISERIGGLFRPFMIERLSKVIGMDTLHRSENVYVQLLDSDSVSWLKPNILTPSSSLMFPAVTWNVQSDLLPSKNESKLLLHQYFLAVDPLAHIVHKPSFARYSEGIEYGQHLPMPEIALIACICFAAAVSMSPSQIEGQFGGSKQVMVDRLMANAEAALKAANFMTTSKIKVLQAFTIYLIPQCRGDISRSHSVLVGALMRLAQCNGIHRSSSGSAGHSSATHMQRLLWHQILFLEIRTGEAQGPMPTERTDNLPMPLNINDSEAQTAKVSSDQWTDATFTVMRYECYEIHRYIFTGRVAVDNQEISLDSLFEKVTAKKESLARKYEPMLDDCVPIQRCARAVMTLLLARCDGMMLQSRLHQLSDRLREAVKPRFTSSCISILESAALLETSPVLTAWSWYSSTYQQYHTIIPFLIELHENPSVPHAERANLMIDHVFGPSYGQTRSERVFDLLCLLRDSLAGYLKLRGVKTTGSESSPETQHPTAIKGPNTSYDRSVSWETPNNPQFTGLSEWVTQDGEMDNTAYQTPIFGFSFNL